MAFVFKVLAFPALGWSLSTFFLPYQNARVVRVVCGSFWTYVRNRCMLVVIRRCVEAVPVFVILP